MLEIKDLHKSFGNKKVLNGINIHIDKGDVLGIIGPSGCGKSTFLRCINLLEKSNKGEILFEGNHINKDNVKRIGMVFQQFNLFNHMTVLENIVFAPLSLKIMKKEEAIKKAKNLLKEIGLDDIINNYPSELSGGQKQRVAIIRTLIMKPDIILFDEPTSSLDPEMIGEVTNLMRKIAKEGMTMIVVSHEMNFIKSFCNRVVFMSDGKILEDASSEEIFENPKNPKLKNFLSKIGSY